MREHKKPLSASYMISSSIISFIYALCVFGVMLLDNLGEFTYFFDSDVSVAYLFFNTSVFPEGLFYRYLSPCLLFHCIWRTQKKLTISCCGLSDRKPYIKSVIFGTMFGGMCYGLAHVFFLAILSMWFPFVSSSELSGAFSSIPYYVFSQDRNEYIHIFFIIYYGILHGSIWGCFATLCYNLIHSFHKYTIIPFLCQILWITLFRVFNIPSTYRIDLWFYMSEYYLSYIHTALFSLVLLGLNILITIYILKHRGDNNGHHLWNCQFTNKKEYNV